MALKDILKEIENKLEHELKKIEAEEKKALTDIKNKTDNEEKQTIAALKSQKEEKIKSMQQKMETIKKMETRNTLLKAKSNLITQTFNQAVAQLNELSDADYKKWLVESLKALPLKEGEIIPAKGKEKVTEAAMKEAKSTLKLGKAGDFEGGYKAHSEKVDIDNTFASIVEKELRADQELEVAQILFS